MGVQVESSLREILFGIPGNEYTYEQLKETLDTGKAIAFVGAGASASLYPLWGDLVQELATQALRRGMVNEATYNFWLDPDGMDPQQVVRRIKERLGDRTFGEILNEICAYKQGEDGKYYTPAHSALMRMPFAGYVTTNYDPGLLEARRVLRPDVRATSYCDWTEHHAVGSWVTGDVFQSEKCPILFVHGYYQRSDDIVLEEDGYGKAYMRGPYRRLFEKLWGQERLVFVGFGFSDPWTIYIVRSVLSELTSYIGGSPRHIAIVGLHVDKPYTPERRRWFVDSFDANLLFYPVRKAKNGGQDHSALMTVLESLAAPVAEKALPTDTVRPSNQTVEVLKEHWRHETTEDQYYVGRREVMTRLDRWSDDNRVRVIEVTGIGGLGKTLLVGHWLKTQGGATRRHVKGLFYWSFFVDRDVTAFLEALIMFAREELGCTMTSNAETLQEQAVSYLCKAHLLIVLDGLEVMQKGPSMSAYRSLLENDLREFLNRTCRSEHGGLVILTSRFPLAYLKPLLGNSVRLLELDHLTFNEGAELLRRLGVEGTQPERCEVSRHLQRVALILSRTRHACTIRRVDFSP
jgi:hypothetical protein